MCVWGCVCKETAQIPVGDLNHTLGLSQLQVGVSWVFPLKSLCGPNTTRQCSRALGERRISLEEFVTGYGCAPFVAVGLQLTETDTRECLTLLRWRESLGQWAGRFYK